MKAEQLIRILVTITLVEMMAAIGMGVRLQEVGRIARDLRLLLRAAIANYASVPLVTVGLLLWFAPPPLISAGFLIVAVCPGAAYGPPFTVMARGNVAAAVGLMVILAGSSAICTPLLLRALLPMMAKGQILRVDVTRMVVMLLLTQLLPLSAGLALRQSLPALANRLKRPADALSATLNLSVLGLIVIARFEMLTATHLRAFIGMLALVVASMAVGWLFGRPGIENRKAMTFSTSVRNVAVALEIATTNFPGTAAVTAVLVYGLFQTIVLAAVAFASGRLGATVGSRERSSACKASENRSCRDNAMKVS
jgi:BASS family bile acid:Na+ symporter